jgi:hypothetical protein
MDDLPVYRTSGFAPVLPRTWTGGSHNHEIVIAFFFCMLVQCGYASSTDQKFGSSKEDLASTLCQDAFAMPRLQHAAHRKRRYVCPGCQIFVSDLNLDTIGTGLTYSAGKTDKHVSDASRRVLRDERDKGRD